MIERTAPFRMLMYSAVPLRSPVHFCGITIAFEVRLVTCWVRFANFTRKVRAEKHSPVRFFQLSHPGGNVKYESRKMYRYVIHSCKLRKLWHA